MNFIYKRIFSLTFFVLSSLNWKPLVPMYSTSFLFPQRLESDNKVLTKTFVCNEIPERKIYAGLYPFQTKQGLIRVSHNERNLCYPHVLYPDDCTIAITVDRHKENNLLVRAVLNNEIVELVDESEPKEKRRQWHSIHVINDNFKNQGGIWTPWEDDTIKNDIVCKAERNDTLRGGNRLKIWLKQPGEYHFTIPNEADIEMDLSQGNITYLSSDPTRLSIKSSTVNKWGSNGFSSTDKGESWDYYWGNESDPITKLITQKGHINVPEISMDKICEKPTETAQLAAENI